VLIIVVSTLILGQKGKIAFKKGGLTYMRKDIDLALAWK
jgi:hypothetical protein